MWQQTAYRALVDLVRCTSDELSPARRVELRALLDAVFGDRFTDDDWAHALGGVHLLAIVDGALVGHASVVPRTLHLAASAWPDRCVVAGFVEAVATAAEHRRRGIGSALMRAAAAEITAGYQLGALSADDLGFYGRLGWMAWQGPTSVVRDGTWLRTPDDDAVVMVLLQNTSETIDLTSPIACEDRPGDPW